jgi:hypothetical protein
MGFALSLTRGRARCGPPARREPFEVLQHEPEVVECRRQVIGELGVAVLLDEPAADGDVLALAGQRLGEPFEVLQHEAVIVERGGQIVASSVRPCCSTSRR